jgi:hypothetical protein
VGGLWVHASPSYVRVVWNDTKYVRFTEGSNRHKHVSCLTTKSVKIILFMETPTLLANEKLFNLCTSHVQALLLGWSDQRG